MGYDPSHRRDAPKEVHPRKLDSPERQLAGKMAKPRFMFKENIEEWTCAECGEHFASSLDWIIHTHKNHVKTLWRSWGC
jgi:hypothetical protein